MCMASHPRGNGFQQEMVTADGPCWKTNASAWPRKRHAQTQLYLCTAASRPGEWAAPGTFLARQLELGAEWSNTTSQSENWRAWDSHARKICLFCSLFPSSYSSFPFTAVKVTATPVAVKIFKAEFPAPLQNSMLDATKFILSYTCSLGLLIFSFQDHWGCVWWF